MQVTRSTTTNSVNTFHSNYSTDTYTQTIPLSIKISKYLLSLFFNGTQFKAFGMETHRAVCLAFFECVFVVIFEIILLVFIGLYVGPSIASGVQNKKAAFLLVYICLFILGQIFYLGLVFDSAKSQNAIQTVGTTVFNMAMLFYAGVQVYQIEELLRIGIVGPYALPVSIIVLGLMIIFTFFGSWTAYKVYKEYGWALYESHGASLEKKRMLRTFNILDLLLKFSIYFNFGTLIQVIAAIMFDQFDQTTPNLNTAQAVSVWAVGTSLVLIALLYYHLGTRAITQCSSFLMICFLTMILVNVIGLAIGLVYLIDDRFHLTINFLLFFMITTVLLNLCTFSFGIFCWYDFEDGLSRLITVMKHKEPDPLRNQIILD